VVSEEVNVSLKHDHNQTYIFDVYLHDLSFPLRQPFTQPTNELNYVKYDIFHGLQTHHSPFAVLKFVAIDRWYAVCRIVL